MQAKEQGFALPMVLIVLALIVSLCLMLVGKGSQQVENARVQKERWNAQLEVYNALQDTIWILTVGVRSPAAIEYGNIVIRLNGEKVKINELDVSVQDAAGLLPLEFFQEVDFEKLISQLTTHKKGRKIAALMGDWVDGDAYGRTGGMEKEGYLAHGYHILPRNRPFRTLDELLEVPGMSYELFNGVKGKHKGFRDLVIAGNAGEMNYATAGAELLGAMLQLSDNQVQTLLEAQKSGRWRDIAAAVVLAGRDVGSMMPSNRYIIVIQGRDGVMGRFDINLTVQDDGRIYKMNSWQLPDFPRG